MDLKIKINSRTREGNEQKTTNTQLKWKVNGRNQIEHLKHTRMVQDEANEDEPK